MKILGSGKIDDFQKIILSDKVVRALNVKSGDSVLFYRGNDDRVEMFKAEGAKVTDEFDSRPRVHCRGIPSLMRVLLAVTLMLAAVALVLAYGYNHIENGSDAILMADLTIVVLALVIAMVIAMYLAIRTVDPQTEMEKLITVGGPYSKDRLIGLTKLSSDGRIVSSSLYINSLFGSNPESVEARIDYNDGRSDVALMKCTKSVPGYSVHKVRFQSEKLSDGVMTIELVYRYSDKLICVNATYDIRANSPDGLMAKACEGRIEAELRFDDRFQRSTFDESIFDPTDDDIVL